MDEIESEAYFIQGGKRKQQLQTLAKHYPISLHGTGLSLASSDELNWQHLAKLRELCQDIDACLVSDHLAWTSINGHYLHTSLPLPYTDEMLTHLITRIKHVQTYLGRQLLIENCAHYLRFIDSTYSEANFLNELAEQTQCGISLDLTSLYVSSQNLNFNAQQYLRTIHPKHIQSLHIGAFKTRFLNGEQMLIASKDQPIPAAIWALYHEAIKQLGAKPTLIEWETALPTIETFFEEAKTAEKHMRDAYVAAKLAG